MKAGPGLRVAAHLLVARLASLRIVGRVVVATVDLE
jgi:hypothetical protein